MSREYICGIFAEPKHSQYCPRCDKEGDLKFMVGEDVSAKCDPCNVEWGFKTFNARKKGVTS